MRPKRDTFDGMFQRHKGLLIRGCILVLVILSVVWFIHRPSGGSSSSLRYAVVFDAGSTGSRIHVFKFVVSDGKLQLESDTMEAVKPGLSAYADDPQRAAQSLQPLLDIALHQVPKALQASTPVMVGATAGLRLLPEGKADRILEAVTDYLQKSSFLLKNSTYVRVIDGTEEGAFAWLTLNYLLGYLGNSPSETVAAIDLGGGSVQQAFALPEEVAATVPDSKYVVKFSGGGKEYDVYVHSYLGFGLMAGRAAVLSAAGEGGGHPCILSGQEGAYEYGGKSHAFKAMAEGASFEKCAERVIEALRKEKECGAPQDECSFDGVWNGKQLPEVLYVSSYFWDRGTEAKIIIEESVITAKVQVGSFQKAAQQACALQFADLASHFPTVQDSQAPYLCLDLAFMHAMLHKGFKIPDDHTITLVKRILYKGQEVEAAWPVGAAINLLES